MSVRSSTRVSNWLRKLDREKVGNLFLVAVFYLMLAFGAGIASILWRFV